MSGPALERVFRAASGRIIAVLAARYRDLMLAEDGFSEACLRALVNWPANGVPGDPAAWLYRTANRVVLDALRHRRVTKASEYTSLPDEPSVDATPSDDHLEIPDERLRLIFICCHPALAPEARAALTLRLVCGLTTTEIARAFLVPDATLAQRLVRAQRMISEARVPFELPSPLHWLERMDSVLSTLEIAYAKAHADASGTGRHASYSGEVLQLTGLLTELVPTECDAFAVAALVRYAEARRAARVDAAGCMVPLSDQDPGTWDKERIREADALFLTAKSFGHTTPRLLQAELQHLWCTRRSLSNAPPWRVVLGVYDQLLTFRDDHIIRVNRAVALAEVSGPHQALQGLESLDRKALDLFIPYHAVRADLLARVGRSLEARQAYERVLSLDPGPAEACWIQRRLIALSEDRS